MHLFCDVIIGITFRRNSVEMYNKISMNSKVVKYLNTKELSEAFDYVKVKKNLTKSGMGEKVPCLSIRAHFNDKEAITAVDNEVNTETGD